MLFQRVGMMNRSLAGLVALNEILRLILGGLRNMSFDGTVLVTFLTTLPDVVPCDVSHSTRSPLRNATIRHAPATRRWPVTGAILVSLDDGADRPGPICAPSINPYLLRIARPLLAQHVLVSGAWWTSVATAFAWRTLTNGRGDPALRLRRLLSDIGHLAPTLRHSYPKVPQRNRFAAKIKARIDAATPPSLRVAGSLCVTCWSAVLSR